MVIQPGTYLKGQYRIDALIGGGGMAMVYRAFDYNLQRVCAIKQNMYTAAAAQQQFHLEAVTLAGLNHAHLVRVLDHFLGEPLHIDNSVTGEKWDMAPKQGDVPARLLLYLRPGKHTFVDNTPRGHGRIGVRLAHLVQRPHRRAGVSAGHSRRL